MGEVPDDWVVRIDAGKRVVSRETGCGLAPSLGPTSTFMSHGFSPPGATNGPFTLKVQCRRGPGLVGAPNEVLPCCFQLHPKHLLYHSNCSQPWPCIRLAEVSK
eukprot:8710284-Pyramimonas_sp.AAC.1